MLPVQEKQIGDNTYEVTAFTAKTGIDMLKRLTSVAGPSISTMIESQQRDNIFEEDGPLTKAVKLLVENFGKDDIYALLTKLLSNTKCNGQAINFDLHFAAKYDELFQVVLFVIEVNRFFPQLSALSTS